MLTSPVYRAIAPETALSRHLSTDRLLARICVRPPYFALSDLSAEAGRLNATARAELPRSQELGPIQGAELSRHAAIAGLCAAALAQADDQRRYYLAQKAQYTGFLNDAPYGSVITLQAELLNLSKREATARIEAFAGGKPLAVVEVEYTILTDSAFSRLFRSRARPEFSAEGLGRMPALPDGTIQRDGPRWIRRIGEVPVQACAGHFDRYPAMPVAILMGQLSQLAGLSLGGDQAFFIPHAEVVAHDFCWAGESATFEVEETSAQAANHVFACQAEAAGRTVGQMQLTLSRR
ncbi:hypothetical protein [Deinococcus aerophilus]|nr:hypothetical protein [Deinococcus aerophilus]